MAQFSESKTLLTQTDDSVSDRFNRPVHDLRISVIDRCNFRCPYCMPEGEYSKQYDFLKRKDWLTLEEIERIARIFVTLGVRKIRLTGGEPLLRPGIVKLIARLKKIERLEDLALTTNGSFLAQYAPELKKAGLDRLTVSLDALDDKTFLAMSGGKGTLANVMNGINEAGQCGFRNIKINAVIKHGVNADSLLELAEYFRHTPYILRFIEYMDVGNCNHWKDSDVIASKKIISLINGHFPLEPLEQNYFGEVASRYRYTDGAGEIGFISSVTQPFCRDCTRVRVSTDGQVITCLFAEKGTDIKKPLRSGCSDEDLLKIIKTVWQGREDRYSELRGSGRKSSKIEMFYIGG